MTSKKRKTSPIASSTTLGSDSSEINEDNRPFRSMINCDLEVIASDGFRFQTRRVILMATSTVLADMLAMPVDGDGRSELSFADETLETAEMVGAFLRLIHGHELEARHGERLDDLIELLRKYDAETALNFLRHQLRASLAFKVFNEFDVFKAFAHLGDVKGCAESVRKGWGLRFSRQEGGVESWEFAETKHNIAGERRFDPAGWGEELIKTIPSKITVALLRAIRWTEGAVDVNLDAGHEVAARFEQYSSDKGGW